MVFFWVNWHWWWNNFESNYNNFELGTMKQAAATSALFIFFNSISGFFGYYLNDGFIPFEKLIIIPFVIFGAIIGSFYGSNKLSNYILSYFLVIVLFLASIKLLLL